MTEEQSLTCTVCRKHKAKLKPRKSKLISGMGMFLCSDCFDSKFEPRWAVILVARDKSRGLEEVRTHIRNHLYYGEKISVEELV